MFDFTPCRRPLVALAGGAFRRGGGLAVVPARRGGGGGYQPAVQHRGLPGRTVVPDDAEIVRRSWPNRGQTTEIDAQIVGPLPRGRRLPTARRQPVEGGDVLLVDGRAGRRLDRFTPPPSAAPFGPAPRAEGGRGKRGPGRRPRTGRPGGGGLRAAGPRGDAEGRRKTSRSGEADRDGSRRWKRSLPPGGGGPFFFFFLAGAPSRGETGGGPRDGSRIRCGWRGAGRRHGCSACRARFSGSHRGRLARVPPAHRRLCCLLLGDRERLAQAMQAFDCPAAGRDAGVFSVGRRGRPWLAGGDSRRCDPPCRRSGFFPIYVRTRGSPPGNG